MVRKIQNTPLASHSGLRVFVFHVFFSLFLFFTFHSPALTFADYLSRSTRSRGVVFHMFSLNIRRIFHLFVLLSRLVITPMSDTRWLFASSCVPPSAIKGRLSREPRLYIKSRSKGYRKSHIYFVQFRVFVGTCAIVKISKHYSVYTVYTFKYAWL